MFAYDALCAAENRRLATTGSFLAKTYCYAPGTGPSKCCIGEILLNREDLEYEYVAHEAAHAAIWWAKKVERMNVNAVGSEEWVCAAIGRLTQCIIMKMIRELSRS